MLRLIQHPLMYVCVLSALCSIGARVAECADQQKRALFSEKVVGHICSDGGAWLRCYSIRPETCSSVAKSVVRPCVDSILESVESVQNEEEGRAVTNRLMDCFNERFLQYYGAGKLSTPECKDPPPHLQ